MCLYGKLSEKDHMGAHSIVCVVNNITSLLTGSAAIKLEEKIMFE